MLETEVYYGGTPAATSCVSRGREGGPVMSARNIVRPGRWFAILVMLVSVVMTTGTPMVYGQGPGGPAGVEIQIRAENRSTSDTPFCGVGGGMVGDRLKVDAFMDMNGIVTGRAVFEDANGAVTVIDLNRF